MNENENIEEKMRSYFKDFVNVYVQNAKKASLPADKEKLEKIIDSAEFKIFEMEGMTGTFSVNRRLIRVI